MEGWIKLSMTIFEWEWFYDDIMLRGWIYLLLKANHKDGSWHGLEVKRGQLVTSLSTMARDMRISMQQARRILSTLKQTYEIACEATSHFTLISICKYEFYQSEGKQKQQANQQANQQAHQQAIQQQLKNYKNRKKQESPPNSPPGDHVDDKGNAKDKEKPSFVDPAFDRPFSMWLEYKQQRKQSYKSELSLKVCYNKLVRLAGGDPATAKAIVEQSIANNWAGLFTLKDNKNGTDTQQPTSEAGRLPGQAQGKNPLAGYDKIIKA